jgi:hypothetical protein
MTQLCGSFKNQNLLFMSKIKIILFSMWATSAFAQIKSVHISVVQGVSTNGTESKNMDYHFSFNLFSGTVRSIKGVEIGSLYNQNEGEMTGFQVSGLLNVTKGNVKGHQLAGLTNVSQSMTGLQLSGISNHAKDAMGIQTAGIANTAQNVKGVQLSGIYNQAKTLKGYQIGLINVADSIGKGGGIGLINLYKKGGYQEVEISAADYQNIGLSFKSGTNTLFTIINIGYNIQPVALFNTGGGIGSVLEIKNNWFFKPELMWYSHISKEFDFDKTSNSSRLKLGIMRKFGKLGFTLSPSIYYANIPNDLDSDLSKITSIKAFSQTKNGRLGFGIGFGVSFLK